MRSLTGSRVVETATEAEIADLLLALSGVIVTAKLLEELVAHYGYPPVLGDILAGIILGPSVLDVLSPRIVEGLDIIKWLGIVSLLFLAGMETKFTEFMKGLKDSTIVAFGGIVFSYLLGVVTGLYLGMSLEASLFLGVTLTATSVGLTVRTLTDLGAIGTRIFSTIIGAAVLDDVGGLLVLGLTISLVSSTAASIEELIYTVILAVVFYVLIVFSLHKGSEPLWSIIRRIEHLEDTSIALLLSLTLVIAWASVKFNLSLVVGAYAVGLAFSEIKGSRRVIERFSLIPNIFATVFFVLSTATVDLKPYLTHTEYLVFIGLILVAGYLGKILGCGLTARLARYNWLESLIIGIGMLPRAEVALVVISIGSTMGAFKEWTDPVIASIIVLIYVSSISTPIILSRLWRKYRRETHQ